MIDVILESLGVGDVIKTYITVIKDNIFNEINDLLKSSEKRIIINKTIDIRKLVDLKDYKSLPINKIRLNITIFNNTNKTLVKAEIPTKNFGVKNLKKDNENIDSYEIIDINLLIHKQNTNDDVEIFNYISHELTHALEFFKINTVDKDYNISHLKNFGLNDYFSNRQNNILNEFINIIYLTFPHELNARITQTYYQLLPLIEKEIDFKSYLNLDSISYKEDYNKLLKDYKNNFKDLLIKNRNYKIYLNLRTFNALDYLNNKLRSRYSDEEIKSELNKFFNYISIHTKTTPKNVNDLNMFFESFDKEHKKLMIKHFKKLVRIYTLIITDLVNKYRGHRL
jgi:hypothetical protein